MGGGGRGGQLDTEREITIGEQGKSRGGEEVEVETKLTTSGQLERDPLTFQKPPQRQFQSCCPKG
jgi:hypothetical protein